MVGTQLHGGCSFLDSGASTMPYSDTSQCRTKDEAKYLDAEAKWQTTDELIEMLEATVRGWNVVPTPFAWGGVRAARYARSRERHHLGVSGACTFRSVCRRPMLVQ